MKTKSGSPQLCRFYAPRFRFPPSSPARGRPGIGLHSICLVDRCDRRCGQKLDQRLRGQWLLGGGWGTRHVYQVRALQIGWSRADNIDARDLYELADRLYADLSLAALEDFTISQPRADPRWSTSQTHHPADCPHIFRCCGGRPGLENSSIQSWRLTPRLALGPDDDKGRATGDADFGGLAACALDSSRFRVTASASSCSA